MALQLAAVGLILVASVVQLLLDYFWYDRPESRRRWLARVLVVLVAIGAIFTGVSIYLDNEVQLEVERLAAQRYEQAQAERQDIAAQVAEVVALGRKGNPGLSEQEALQEVIKEVTLLRGEAAKLESDLEGLRRYRAYAKYDAAGRSGLAGEGLKDTNPIALALAGTYDVLETPNGQRYRVRCNEGALSQFQSVAQSHPDFPFSHWAIAICLARLGVPEWRVHADRALVILEHTTEITAHSPSHDEAKDMLEALLENTPQ